MTSRPSQKLRTVSKMATADPAFPSVIIATLTGFDANEYPLVAVQGSAALPARTTVQLGAHHVGESVALQFENGDANRPLIVGLLRPVALQHGLQPGQWVAQSMAVTVDEQELVITATRRITLQCGKASITLNEKGQIEIRGTQLVSRASGQNRIKGASVSLN